MDRRILYLVLSVSVGAALSLVMGLDCSSGEATLKMRAIAFSFFLLMRAGFYVTMLYPRGLASTEGRAVIDAVPDVISVSLIRLIGLVGSAGAVWMMVSVVAC